MRDKTINKLFLICLICFFYQLSSYATDYTGGFNEFQSALSSSGTNTFTANSDVILNTNFNTMSDTILTIYGNNQSIIDNGSLYKGLSVSSGKTLNINNFGTYSGTTPTSAIENFTSTPSNPFLNNASGGIVNISNSVFYNNQSTYNSSTSGGGVIYSAGTLAVSIRCSSIVCFTN